MKRPTRGVTALVAALMIVSGCGGQSEVNGGSDGQTNTTDVLIFAPTPAEEEASLRQSYQAVIDMLSAETGKAIRFRYATDYAAVIEGLRTGEIDIAQLGPLSYVLAKQQGAQITLVAAQSKEKGGNPGYQSYGITRTGSPIRTLADFRGKKVCFVDEYSASGYLYPSAGLLTVGITPLQDTTPIFAGGHDAAVLAVASGQCDAGFAQSQMVESELIEKGQIQPGQITTVWKSAIIPGAPAVIAADLSPDLQRQLTTALLDKANADYLREHGFCSGGCPIGDEDSYGYVTVDDADYDPVREVCRFTRHKSCMDG